ncbi:MAG: serine--tRNA ligase [bacterium]
MLDIKRIVEDKQNVEKSLLKRMSSSDLNLDEIIKDYEDYKEKLKAFEDKRAQQKDFNDKFAKVEKGSDEFKKLLDETKKLAKDVKKLEEEARKEKGKWTSKLEVLPNIPDEDVPSGEKESNKVIKEYGKKPEFDFESKDHLEVATNLGLVDFDRAAKLAGAQFILYRGDGAVLEWALLNFFIEEHRKDGYEFVLPPHLLTEESGYGAGQLPKFKEDVYWTQDKSFLLPTAETALSNLFRDEVLNEEDLPKKMFSYSPCYRKEAGSYRSNERGLMRVHQFNKVEMFQYTTQEQSEEALEELVGKASNLVEKLGLHFRLSLLAAGDCSAAAAKTYDIEAYIPSLDMYYEVSSASNVRDYQARRGNIRYKTKDGETKYVHMLNASGLATSRLLVSLLETYQQKDGSLVVPDVLRKFVGKDVIEPK